MEGPITNKVDSARSKVKLIPQVPAELEGLATDSRARLDAMRQVGERPAALQ